MASTSAETEIPQEIVTTANILSSELSTLSQPDKQPNENTTAPSNENGTAILSTETSTIVAPSTENTPTPSKKKKLISMKPLKRLSNSFSNLFTSPSSKPEEAVESNNIDERESIIIVDDESTVLNTIPTSIPTPAVVKEVVEKITCEPLKKNLSILSPQEVSLADILLSLQQDHLFKDWEDVGINDDKKHEFFTQVATLNSSYPNGLTAYITKARELLEASKTGANPLDGWMPYVPKGIVLDPYTEEYTALEEKGKSVLGRVGFVLVAGGLGERLGYNGIKVELPVETTTHICYLELYCQELLAFQTRYANNTATTTKFELPLAIMVSDDTYSKTLALLEKNNYFGLQRHQVTLMKQEKVAALKSADAAIASLSLYVIDSKPHGHGDVHSLMHSTGTASKWLAQGFEYVAFFQDTNGLSFVSLAAMLGVSVSLDLHVNSLTVPRHAKEAVGGITRLVKQKTTSTSAVTAGEGSTEELKVTTEGVTSVTAAATTDEEPAEEMTVNVEYNQIDPLLRSSPNYPQGDVNDDVTGLSPFPGNINQLVFKLAPYLATLDRTGGHMSEFVNPKYADTTKTVFKKPTRLECMMQDYPKILSREDAAKVGFTMAPAWLCYSPCKNNSADAAVSVASGVPAGSAFTSESDQYNVYTQLLKKLNVHIESAEPVSFSNITAIPGPRICFHPSFALLPTEIKARFPTPEKVYISKTSTLVIKGDVVIHSLSLDGALRLTAVPGTRLYVHAGDESQGSGSVAGVTTVTTTALVQNKGHTLKSIADMSAEESATLTEVDKMRGYKIQVIEEDVINTISLIDRVTSLSQQLHKSASNAVATSVADTATTTASSSSLLSSIAPALIPESTATTTSVATTSTNTTTTTTESADTAVTTTDLAAVATGGSGNNIRSVSSSQDTDVAAAATDVGSSLTETDPLLGKSATAATEGDEVHSATVNGENTLSTATEALATLHDITSAFTAQTKEVTTSITHAVQDSVTSVVDTINSTITTAAASVGVPEVIEFVYTGKTLLPRSAYEPLVSDVTAGTDGTERSTALSTQPTGNAAWPCFQLSLGPIKIC